MTDRPAWTARATVAAALFVLIVVAQVAPPAVALLQPRPVRFGWQMYTAMTYEPQAWTEDESGMRKPVDLSRLTADARAEIDWSEPLARVLCGDDRVRYVVVAVGKQEERIPCA